ncbi:MAG: MlaC/ttg2D family ABC transporter substrate-binding protein, partial [Candidatus Binatia bacterium]
HEETMKKLFFRYSWPPVLCVVTIFAQPLYADSTALEHLKTSLTSVQQVLNDPKLTGEKHFHQRRILVRIVLQKLFDFDEMSRRSLGANARRHKDRLPEFTPLFVDFLEHTYMAELEANGDAKIHYVKEIRDGNYVHIKTATRLKDRSEYGVDYKLHHTPEGWRVYDVIVEGISLVNNYRSQFDRMLTRRSFDDLLQELRDKKEKFN